MYILAVDIGGTKIATGLLNSANEWVHHDKFASDASSEDAMFEALVKSIDQSIAGAGLALADISAIGVTVPGQIDADQGIAIFQNNLPWRNFPLKEKLQVIYPEQKLAFEHDVVSAAIGEWEVRNLKDELFVYMTVSTGISSSIIYQGQPIRGKGLAGEVGLMPLKAGKSLEDCASGPAMEKALVELDPSTQLIQAFDQWQDTGERYAEFFEARAMELAQGLYTLLSLFDAHRLVLGGGVINHQPRFFEAIVTSLASLCIHPFQKDWPARIEASLNKHTSGLYGIAKKADKIK